MTRYYGLVLVPGEAADEEMYSAAAKLLYPHMRSDEEPEREYKFDWFFQPDDIADDEEGLAQYMWRAADIVEQFPELEVEAIITPDGKWYGSELGLWDDEEWVGRAQQLLQRHGECMALKHLFHI